MNSWITAAVVLGLLAVGSVASAGWTYVAPVAVPAPVVYLYWAAPPVAVAPVSPVYVYRPAAVTVYRPAPVAVYRPAPVTVYRPAPVTVYSPVVTPAVPEVSVAPEAVAPAPVVSPWVYPGPYVYPGTVVIRAKVYYPGQPVRNAVRAVLP